MFADYTTLVLQDYHKKREANKLPLRLINPAPAKLRDECLSVFDERANKKDEKTLKDFFGQGGEKSEILRAIKRCPIDKFRPLVNYMRGATDGTDDKNVELLAWLIDYKDRPYEWGKKLRLGEPNNQSVNSDTLPIESISITDPPFQSNDGDQPNDTTTPISDTLDHPIQKTDSNNFEQTTRSINTGQQDTSTQKYTSTQPTTPPEKPAPKSKTKIVIAILTVPIVVFAVIVTRWPGNPPTRTTNPATAENSQSPKTLAKPLAIQDSPKSQTSPILENSHAPSPRTRMYWTGDHYQQIDSNQTPPDNIRPVPLDEEKLAHFRKIMQPDTMTESCLTRVWTARHSDGEFEFFTEGGYHPTDTTLKLKRITYGQIKKYGKH